MSGTEITPPDILDIAHKAWHIPDSLIGLCQLEDQGCIIVCFCTGSRGSRLPGSVEVFTGAIEHVTGPGDKALAPFLLFRWQSGNELVNMVIDGYCAPEALDALINGRVNLVVAIDGPPQEDAVDLAVDIRTGRMTLCMPWGDRTLEEIRNHLGAAVEPSADGESVTGRFLYSNPVPPFSVDRPGLIRIVDRNAALARACKPALQQWSYLSVLDQVPDLPEDKVIEVTLWPEDQELPKLHRTRLRLVATRLYRHAQRRGLAIQVYQSPDGRRLFIGRS